jgi:glycosyltransferase involved in cell wall biosynthesis
MNIGFGTFNITGHNGNLTYTYQLLSALCEISNEHSYLLATYWKKKRILETLFGKNRSIEILNYYPNPKILGDSLVPLVTSSFKFFDKLVERKCDIFHSTNPREFPFGMKNVVTTIHDLIALRQENWVADGCKKFYNAHIDTILNKSKLIFVNSEYTKYDIVKLRADTENRIIVTHLAASPIFKPVEKNKTFLLDYKLSGNINYLLSVGEIQERKNYVGVLDSFEYIAEKHPEMHLIIIGQEERRNKEYIDLLKKRINESKYGNRISMFCNVSNEQLVKFYTNATAFLYFSFYEGFGLPIIEAMQCNCPVITSSTTSMKEIAENASILVDPYSTKSMREATMKLLDSTELQSELIVKGQKRAESFTWKKTAEKTLEGYERLQNLQH